MVVSFHHECEIPKTEGFLAESCGGGLGWLRLGGEVRGVVAAGVFEAWGDGAGGADGAGCGCCGAGWGAEGGVLRDWTGTNCGPLSAGCAGEFELEDYGAGERASG